MVDDYLHLMKLKEETNTDRQKFNKDLLDYSSVSFL